MNERTKKMTTLAMLSALAFMTMVVFRLAVIPAAPFLKYDPKDVIITIGGFIFGPVSAFLMSFVVSFIEMMTVSESGPIGMVMNILSSCAFACTASYIYKKNRKISGATTGLAIGVCLMVIVMLLWNYFLVPIYQGWPRAAVAEMLIPVFLPFNLVKGGINAAITMLIYKPVVISLRKAGLIPVSEQSNGEKNKINTATIIVSLFILATCIVFILVLQGAI